MEWSYFIQRVCDDVSPVVHNPEPIVMWLNDDALQVQGAQLLYLPFFEKRGTYSTDFMFVGRVTELPEDPSMLPRDCLCINNAPLPKGYSDETVKTNLIVVDCGSSDLELMLLLNHVSFVLADEFRFYRGMERINRAERESCGLARMIDIAERIAVNPVLLLDNKRNVLAVGSRYRFFEQQLNDEVANGQLSRERLEQINAASGYEQLRTNYAATEQDLAWGRYRFLSIPIRLHGLEVARLILQNSTSAFHLSTVQLMEPLANTLSSMISRRLDAASDRALMHDLLFSELLHATPDRNMELHQWASELRWRECEGMRLLCCAGPINGGDEAFEILRSNYPTARWMVKDDRWLLLVYPNPDSPDLESTLEQNGFIAGASWPFDNLMQIPNAYVQAEAALQRSHGGSLTEYAQVFAAHIYSIKADMTRQHLHPSVLKLATYEESHGGELLQTLEHYLADGEQPTVVAKHLHISRSALFYRLNRIREICGAVYDTGETRMNLLLSIRLLREIETN